MKTIKMLRTNVLLASCLLAAVFLVGCAAGGGSKKEESLADRAVARWNLIINKDPGAAWNYLTPGTRAATPQNVYVNEMLVKPVNWTEVEFVEQTCEREDVCIVKVKISFKIRSHLTGVGMVGSDSYLNEKWIRTNGNWYFLPPEK